MKKKKKNTMIFILGIVYISVSSGSPFKVFAKVEQNVEGDRLNYLSH